MAVALVNALIVAGLVLIGAGTGRAATRPCQYEYCPALGIAPSTDGTYDFGPVELGQTATQLFTVSNTGTRSTSKLTLAFVGPQTFLVTDDLCTFASLKPGQSCTFQIGYVPVAPRTDTGTVTVSGHRPNVAVSVGVTGTGWLRHIYWANPPNSIGRAGVDGTDVTPDLVGTFGPVGVTVDSGYVYWTVQEEVGWTYEYAIGRAHLNGANPDNGFITGLSEPQGVAADSSYVYWAEAVTGTIGRANLDGTNPKPDFITGLDFPRGVAVDSSHVYWTTCFDGMIGRANLDGTDVKPDFITGLSCPQGVAVDAG
jgi:hypothetical protein